MKLAWIYDEWSGRWPSRGTDELFRHTVVIPWPFPSGTYDGEPTYRVICFVVAPWWFCPYAKRKAYRDYVRWERGLNGLLALIPEVVDEENYGRLYDDIEDAYTEEHGPRPSVEEAFDM